MMASLSTGSHRLGNVRMVQNFHLVWLDENIDEINNEDCRNTITKLREVVNTVNTFIDADECINFINDIKEKAFMVISEEFSRIIIPIVQNIDQVSCVYIFCDNNMPYEKLVNEWPKLNGVFTDITSLCEALEQVVQDCEHNSISISFIKTTDGGLIPNLDTMDSSFMYAQILKDILLNIEFEQIHFNEFLTYCRDLLVNNTIELKNVDKIEKEYRHHQPIWWYTYPCFLYSMLNRALRTMEVDLITKMGFFVQHLHTHIATLHAEQYGGQNLPDSFTVYRGQGLSSTDFDQLKATQSGLLAFNNLVSTSHNRDISLRFARRTITTTNLVGILFVMKIDPSISTTSFANVENASYYQGEQEILFSMHSVFRIGSVKRIDENDRLWQVDLTLTSDNDPELQNLTKSIQKETEGSMGWLRLGKLMIKLAQFDKAQQVFDIMLCQTGDEIEKGDIYYQLGWIKNRQGKYTEAIIFYEYSLEICQKTITHANHFRLAALYKNIGELYQNMGEYSKARTYCEKALEIYRKTLPENHPHLAISYNNVASVYGNIGEYSTALSYYEKALEIFKKILPASHSSFVTSYNSIGRVYGNMGEYSKALSYYEKALEICQKILPVNHSLLTVSYNNIGLVYNNMGDYSKALSYYEKVLEIRQETIPADHPSLATSYNNMGSVYHNMGEYLTALSYYEKALESRQEILPANHPSLATSYNNMGSVYLNMGKYSKALSYYEKALEIEQKTLPANHPHLATFYNNIGGVYDNMGEYSTALSYYQRALEIFEKNLPSSHPSLATSYNNIGLVYYNVGKCSKALSYYEKALEIEQKTLPANHPHLATSYNNIGVVYKYMGEYFKALSHYEKALEIEQKTLPVNHPHLATSYNNIGVVYKNMGQYFKALSHYERAMDIFQRSLPPNHPSIKALNECIENVKKEIVNNF